MTSRRQLVEHSYPSSLTVMTYKQDAGRSEAAYHTQRCISDWTGPFGSSDMTGATQNPTCPSCKMPMLFQVRT